MSTDLRIQKTIRAVRQAFLTLVAKKPYDSITAPDIIREALIDRHTFYRHFASVDAVLVSVEHLLLEELAERLKSVPSGKLWGGY